MILLEAVLAPEDVERVRRELATAPWRDGKATAGPAARPVKANSQAASDSPQVEALERFVRAALTRHPLFDLAVRPRRLSRLLFSRYGVGEAYGPHTDDALQGDPPLRTDIAFTLFLSDPATYDGGALAVTTALGEQAIRLSAGDAFIYPADTIHRVEPVTRGERLACVGWAQSLIRDPRHRDILFELAQTRAALGSADAAAALHIDKVRANLLRLWAEP